MNLANSLRHVVVIGMACSIFAACSAAQQSSLVPSSGSALMALSGANGPLHAARSSHPLEKLCEPIVYDGFGWQYEPSYNQWWGYVGPWTYGAYNMLVPCAGDLVIAKFTLHPWNWWWDFIYVRFWAEEKNLYATQISSSTVGIVQITKKSVSQVETINVSPYAATGLAVSPTGNMYVGVMSQGSPTNPPSCIVIYPPKSSYPEGMLQDANMGPGPVAVAADRRSDVFGAYTLSSSGVTRAQIDEFPKGSIYAKPYATIPGVTAEAITTAKNGEVLVTATAGSSGVLFVLKSGRMAGKFATTSDPAYISLNSTNGAVTVSDPVNNIVSTYAFPSGKLESQVSLGSPSQQWSPGEMIQS